MFIVFNKQKIYSYIISFCTVIALFIMAFVVMEGKTIVTSTNYIEDSNIENNEIEEINVNE